MLLDSREINRDVINAIIFKGARCNIYLKPEHENTARAKDHEYIENYLLPNFLIQGDKLVAFTNGDHLPDAVGFFQGRRSYYAYSNVNDLFINFIPKHTPNALPTIDTRMMSLSRYREIEWILRDNAELLYDGKNCMEAKDLISQKIRKGKNFRLSLQNHDGNWFIHDIDLPFYVINEDHFQFQTVIHWYPKFFQDLVALESEVQSKNFPKKDNKDSQEFAFDLETSGGSTYLSVFSNGEYQNADNLMQNSKSHYQRMILFCY